MSPTNTITVYVTKGDTDWGLFGVGIALFFGVSLEEVQQLGASVGGNIRASDIPDEMRKNGMRRAREAYAATGGVDLLAAIEYWAAKDHSAAVEFVLADASGNPLLDNTIQRIKDVAAQGDS